MSITFEQQADGSYTQVDDPPKLADMVAVVRCRDCEHRRRHWNGHAPNFTADFFCSYTGGHEVKPDGFCAWGVSK